ncbi:MAG: hypothetical protein CO080_05285, partial [Nitrospirae bacterium CG_4_9_14_0_8_um_filter_70_14]
MSIAVTVEEGTVTTKGRTVFSVQCSALGRRVAGKNLRGGDRDGGGVRPFSGRGSRPRSAGEVVANGEE